MVNPKMTKSACNLIITAIVYDMNRNSSRSKRAYSVVNYFYYLLYSIVLLTLCLPSSLYGKKVLTVGVYNNKPTIFVSESGVVQGLFIDILDDIALQENWDIEYVAGHLRNCTTFLKPGQ